MPVNRISGYCSWRYRRDFPSPCPVSSRNIHPLQKHLFPVAQISQLFQNSSICQHSGRIVGIAEKTALSPSSLSSHSSAFSVKRYPSFPAGQIVHHLPSVDAKGFFVFPKGRPQHSSLPRFKGSRYGIDQFRRPISCHDPPGGYLKFSSQGFSKFSFFLYPDTGKQERHLQGPPFSPIRACQKD